MEDRPKKPSFLMYADNPAFDMLDDQNLGRFFRACLKYIDGGDEIIGTSDDRAVQAVWRIERKRLEREREKYLEKCGKLAENGKKGGLAKASNCQKRLANLAYTDTDSEPYPDTDTELEPVSIQAITNDGEEQNEDHIVACPYCNKSDGLEPTNEGHMMFCHHCNQQFKTNAGKQSTG